MTREQKLGSDRLNRVQRFGQDFASHFREGSPARQAFEALAPVVNALNQDAANGVSTAFDGVSQKPAAKDALVLELDAIARTARLIAQSTPGFDERFQPPRPRTYRRVLSTAHAYLREAEPAAPQFIARGLPVDFVSRLRSAVQAFERASEARDSGALARASAREGVKTALREGLRLVRTLDLIIRYQFRHEPEMQASWQRAVNLGGRRHKKDTANRPDTPTPAPPTTSPPVHLAESSTSDPTSIRSTSAADAPHAAIKPAA